MNQIVTTYSRLAAQYDEEDNIHSCWGRAADKAVAAISLKERYRSVVDVGCGTGRALLQLASEPVCRDASFVGIEPALNMRALAARLTEQNRRIRILDGAFEDIPLAAGTVDYLYSILAFHWTTDVERSVDEVFRVLNADGEVDLFFIGRNNGQEFIRKTTPIFLKYMGPALLLQSATMRKQLTKEAAHRLFEKKSGGRLVTVNESYQTYYDTLERHWSWWVRIEGHFVQIPPEKKRRCDDEVKEAIAALKTDLGIPYTIHMLHVKVRSRAYDAMSDL